MAGKIVVSEILSDATSSNTVKIGSGMTLDLNAQGTTVLPTIPVSKMPAGSVIQVIHGAMSGSVQLTTSNWAVFASEFTKTVTPQSSSSKFLLQYNISWYVTANAGLSFKFTKTVGGTESDLYQPADGYEVYGSADENGGRATEQYLDSPGTSSAITYKTYARGYNTNTAFINRLGNFRSSFTLMEIAG